MREAVIALIVLVALYMLFVLLRMRRLRRPSGAPAVPPVLAAATPAPQAPPADPAEPEPESLAPAAVDEWPPLPASPDDAALRPDLAQEVAQEVAQLREELDAIRGELAALREDMLHEMAHMRATQSVSPIYGDAMQMAAAGYEPALIAERCGIARAEAELVVALAKSQER